MIKGLNFYKFLMPESFSHAKILLVSLLFVALKD